MSARDHYTNILRFWRSVETFNLPDIPFRKQEAIFTFPQPGDVLPWEKTAPVEGRRWKHTLYFHLVQKEKVIGLLAKLTASTEYREPVTGETCLSALVVDQSGCPGPRSYAPAAYAYAIKLLRERHNPEELTEELKQAQEEYRSRFKQNAEEEPIPVTWTALKKELAHLRKLMANALPATDALLCVSELTSPAATPDAPFLNSHYIQDLDTLIRHPGSIGRPLQQLLTPAVVIENRRDLLEPHRLLAHLHPRNMSPGRWPANPAHGLYSAQQAALRIAAGTTLIGINGPPGTGKTTLLREVIADIIVGRARRLLAADPDHLFGTKRVPITEKAAYYPIDQALFGNDGIVVASNNNTAIENISRELPLLKSIDPAAFPETDYFSGIATHVFGAPAWGLVSAVLGRSDNRSAFIDKFWFSKGRNFNRYLRELTGEEEQAKEHFSDTAAELARLLQAFDRFRELAGVYHDAITSNQRDKKSPGRETPTDALATTLIIGYEIAPENLPGPEFETLPMETIHRLTPYSSQKLNKLRGEIFLRSLELHEWAIRAHAASFQTNLGSFVDLLSGKHRERITEEIAVTLWNTFFFCIPVVSVTLASFHRQFGKLGRGTLGVLLLDEAGQATLPSVAGALWRAERSIFIGDTRQIVPVVNIPRALDDLLRKNYNVTAQWSPLDHSAQSLADRITPLGSWLDDHSSETGLATKTWTGVPLRAHRRCDEPMFSIANTIAYNNTMVRVDNSVDKNSTTLPPSAWLDVRGSIVIDGHALKEELDSVRTLLQELTGENGPIFIISPFRSVAEANYKNFQKKGHIECGTIHTFQGREADMVVLVLGTAPHNKKARNWVAATPNILNVAVTRARRRLYVIGNRHCWGQHRYFDQLAKSLPVRPPAV